MRDGKQGIMPLSLCLVLQLIAYCLCMKLAEEAFIVLKERKEEIDRRPPMKSSLKHFILKGSSIWYCEQMESSNFVTFVVYLLLSTLCHKYVCLGILFLK